MNHAQAVLFARLWGAVDAVMEADNRIAARVRDTVKVVFRASSYLKGTMLYLWFAVSDAYSRSKVLCKVYPERPFPCCRSGYHVRRGRLRSFRSDLFRAEVMVEDV